MTDVGAFFYIENEEDEMKCETCGSLLTEDNAIMKLIDENLEYNPTILCWYCEEDANDPDPYADDSLNEVDMGRFDDDPPEYM